MTDSNFSDSLLGWDEAQTKIKLCSDPRLRQIMQAAIVSIAKVMATGTEPSANFDLVFYLSAITKMLENEAVARSLASGRDLTWGLDDL